MNKCNDLKTRNKFNDCVSCRLLLAVMNQIKELLFSVTGFISLS